MAISFGTASVLAEATTVDSVYTAPSGIANNDLLLIWHFEYGGTSHGVSPTPTAPGGFALVPGTWPIDVVDPQSNHNTQWLWYKIASNESGNYTISHTSCINRGIMARVTGNDVTTPFAPDPTLNSGGGVTTTWTTLTTSVDNELIMLFGSDDNDNK